MIIANIRLKNKLKKVQFFLKAFLLANISVKMVLEMLFLTFNRAKLRFAKKKLIQRSYTAVKALFTTRRIKIINKKEFTSVVLDLEDKSFVIYIVSVKELVYPSQKTLIAGLEVEKVTVPMEYLNFTNVFSFNFTAKLSEHSKINNHLINLKQGKQSLYRPIYSLKPMKLKTLKIYIKTNLASNFIRLSKSPAGISIRFVYKKNNNLWLCVNYQRLNNSIIKNCYPFPLIEESLN